MVQYLTITVNEPSCVMVWSKTRTSRGLKAECRHALGDMIWLLLQTHEYCDAPLTDIEQLIIPPLLHDQFAVFAEKGKPVGFATWARCSAAVNVALQRDAEPVSRMLSFDDWRSGENYWLATLVAPLAYRRPTLRDAIAVELARGPLAGHPFKVKTMRPERDVWLIQTIDELLANDVAARSEVSLDPVFYDRPSTASVHRRRAAGPFSAPPRKS
jgi:hemolysin-activating ACP:hemolysin acyltransferase